MYEINFHTKFSSTWFPALSIVSSRFHFLSSIWECEIKFHTKGFRAKSTKFFVYENFFSYSNQSWVVKETFVRYNNDHPKHSNFTIEPRYSQTLLRQDPLEAILVIFGRRVLIFFGWKALGKNENWHHFSAHAEWWSPWRRKNVE